MTRRYGPGESDWAHGSQTRVTQMKLVPFSVWAGCVLTGAVLAQSPVTVTIGPDSTSAAIPHDFVGMSFGMRNVPPDRNGAHFFSPKNAQLITLFRNIGIKHLRVGGTSVDSPARTPIPNTTDIDQLFGFVQAAGVRKVIYSFRLLETEPGHHYAETNAILAKYIWDHYRQYLDCFALGNEPDHKKVYLGQDLTITNFSTYLQKWRRFAGAITSAVPEAKFAGPDACSGRVEWTSNFARAGKNLGLVAVVDEHFYVGGAGRDKPAGQAIDEILSPKWIASIQRLYEQVAVPVFAEGLPFRFTEANDHYSGGVPNASDTFAGGLWALDFLHWWAAHGACGVNFHNTQWVVNDIITPDVNGRLAITPKGYGIRAFDLGSHGRLESVTVSNPDGLNLTAYAVRGAGEHWVTIINKEHGSGAREAKVTISVPGAGAAARAEVISLVAPNGDATAKTGVTLGGASISADGPWQGTWKPLAAAQSGQLTVNVPAVSAVVVEIAAPSNPIHPPQSPPQ